MKHIICEHLEKRAREKHSLTESTMRTTNIDKVKTGKT